MEKTKGVVMRTSPKVTVIYTSESDFLEIPTPKDLPIVGQTIEVNLDPKRLFMFHNSALKYVSVAAVLFLVLSISVFSLLFIPNMAVASVALNINNNKGIELLLNKNGKVIKEPDANDGSGILEGISTKELDIYQTVDLILENANNKGKLNEIQNLVMANVVPINNKKSQHIDTEKIRNTIRDAMTRRNLSGSVVVSQASPKIQQEATEQGMTMNGYLIYIRSKNKGIVVQPDTLRNDVQKAMVDAQVSATSLFPEESFEVRAQGKTPSAMESPESHSSMNPSIKQSPSSSSTANHGMNPDTPSHSPIKQPMQQTSPNSDKPSSSPVTPGSMPTSQQPLSSPYSGIMGH